MVQKIVQLKECGCDAILGEITGIEQYCGSFVCPDADLRTVCLTGKQGSQRVPASVSVLPGQESLPPRRGDHTGLFPVEKAGKRTRISCRGKGKLLLFQVCPPVSVIGFLIVGKQINRTAGIGKVKKGTGVIRDQSVAGIQHMVSVPFTGKGQDMPKGKGDVSGLQGMGFVQYHLVILKESVQLFKESEPVLYSGQIRCAVKTAIGGKIGVETFLSVSKRFLQFFPCPGVKKDVVARITGVQDLPLIQPVQHKGGNHHLLHVPVGIEQIIGHQEIAHHVAHEGALRKVIPSHLF